MHRKVERRWHQPDRATGRLSSLAYDAVASNFNSAHVADVVEAAALVEKLAIVADGNAIALRYRKITAELVELTHQLMDERRGRVRGARRALDRGRAAGAGARPVAMESAWSMRSAFMRSLRSEHVTI